MEKGIDFDFRFKIVLTGDQNVGKTSILQSFIYHSINEECPNDFREYETADREVKHTVGVDFAVKKVKIPEDDVVVNSMIWDTSGNKGYEMVTLGHFRNSDGALLVFDITNPNSFFNLDKWLDELRKVVDENCIICLVPNKSDLLKDNQSARAVSEGQIRDYVRHNGLLYFGEISSKEEDNVKNCIENLIKEIYFKKKCEDALRPPKHSKIELRLRKEQEPSESSKFKCST